ncbi:lanthionine synthetase LanC family protein [Plantactinospora sp. ZYX-F-223]|uniref:class III lanthionine synthetase LanKC N-terminal domain-containing protein n=1 Tax=Plantactinospora sp. ZYX-F-223 TaxID=3144103 RepID=UPI0031FD0458
MTPESSATASRSSGLAMPVRGRTRVPARPAGWSGRREPADLVVELLDRISLAGWTVQHRAGRTLVAPALPANRLQGWKLHVSATPSNAPEVLAACMPVLVETGTAFGFVGTAAGLAELNGPRAPRAGAGKFLTVHPATDELFRELAKRLDEATVGYVGPAVLSDRPYRSGGVVHYRYGAFGGVGVLDNDGWYRRCLVDPDGNLVEDRCEPVFRPPAWVELPFDSSPERPAPALPGSPVWPTGPTGPGWSVASMQVLGTSTADPVIGSAGTAGSVGGGPGGPAGPGVPARSGGSTEAEGPAGSGGPGRSGESARWRGPVRPGGSARSGGAARPGGPAGSGDPVGPAGAAGSTGAVGSTGTWGPVDPTGPAEVLIGGRYAVTGAIRQANKGGVYRARDLRTGATVLIKEARPYVGTDAYDRDVRDLLGHEARVLRHLLPLGVTPRPLREFVQGNHRFLVEELLPGRPLSADVPDLPVVGPDRRAWPHLLGRLARLVGAVHPVGVVLRDLAPENVLLLPDGELRLVDLELAALRTGGADDWSYLDLRYSGAAGFVAPEQWRDAAPDPAADLFSLGVLALWLAGRVSPAGIDVAGVGLVATGTAGYDVAGADVTGARSPAGSAGPPVRSVEEWVAALLEPSFDGPPVPVPLRRITTGLLRTEPAERIGLDEVVGLCAEASDECGGRRGTAAGTAARRPDGPASSGAGSSPRSQHSAGPSSGLGSGPGAGPDTGTGPRLGPRTGPDLGTGTDSEIGTGAGGGTGLGAEALTPPGELLPEAVATLPEPAWWGLVEESVLRLHPAPDPLSGLDFGVRPGARSTPHARLAGVGWPGWRPGPSRAGPGSDRQLAPNQGRAGLARSVAALARLVADGQAAGESARPAGAAPVLDLLLDRLLHSLDGEPHRLPGLSAGSAAAVWALCDAGRLLGRPYLVDRAVELALRLPVRWPEPGLGYGLAGLGTGLLHLWRHTYLPALRDRITAVAGHLLDAAEPGGAMVWTVDPSFDSVRAGLRSYGLEHGTAGIGAFLLATGELLGRRDLTAAAIRCAETLLDAAESVGGTVRWSSPSVGTWPEWPGCPDDPAGIGSFLCRTYLHTGDARHRDAAVAAARVVVTSRWTRHRGGGIGAYPAGGGVLVPGVGSSGPAGDGEFLLDLARATGDARYAGWAETLAARWWATGAGPAGEAGRPERPGCTDPDPAGRLAFLLRLRLGGSRLFHPDPSVQSGYHRTDRPVVTPAAIAGIGASRTRAGRPVAPCAGGPACRCSRWPQR